MLLRLAEALPFGLLFILGIARGVRFGGDSASYIAGEVYRSPGYVLLLRAYQSFFGADFRILIACQIALGIAAAWLFARHLARRFELGAAWRTGIALFLLIPYFFGDYRIGNTIQSEAVTFPLYLLVFACLLDGLLDRRLRPLLVALIVAVPLLLVRKQLVFALPAAAITGFYLAYRKAIPWRSSALLLLAAVASYAVMDLCERSYEYWRAGRFEPTPFSGLLLLNAPLYFSTADDAALFPEGSEARHYFESFRADLAARNALFESWSRNRSLAENYLFHFGGVYNVQINSVIVKQLRDDGHGDWWEIERIARTLAWPLLRRHLGQVLALDVEKVKFHFGGYYPAMAWMLAGFACAVLMLRRRAPPVIETLGLALMLAIGNALLIASVEPFLRRYTVYTEPILYLTAAIAVFAMWRSSQAATQR